MGAFFLEVTLSRVEAPLEDAALAGGVSLDAAAARGATHLAVSGSTTATTTFLTSKPQRVRLPIPVSAITCIEGDRFELKESTRLLATSERMAASVLGTVCTTMSGQASVHLEDILAEDMPVGVVELRYPNWDDISAALGIRDPQVVHVHEDTKSKVRVHVTEDSALNTSQSEALSNLETLFSEAWNLRDSIVYDDAPTLTKSVMKTPIGINGSAYDLASTVVSKPFSHPTETLEDLLHSSIMAELGGSQEDMSMFLAEDLSSIDRARWAGVVASGLSTAAANTIPYRADGKTVLLPGSKLKHFDTESWMAEPVRPFGSDDCDGSAAWITSAVSHIDVLMNTSSNAKENYKVLNAVHRTLAHYKVGIAVLGAYAASADKVEHASESTGVHARNEPKHIAGHAMVLMLPRAHYVDALHRGTASSMSRKTESGYTETKPVLDPTQDRDEVAKLRFRAAYTHAKTNTINQQFPPADVRALGASYTECGMLDRLRKLPGLAVEGTGAASSTLWVEDHQERATKTHTASRVDKTFEKITPSQAVPMKELDTGAGGEHKFYSAFVEVLFPVSDLSDSLLQEKGLASSHFVFCQSDPVLSRAGATPKQVAVGDYSLVPLWTADSNRANLLLESAAETTRQTLPMSLPPDLTETQNKMLGQSLKFLSGLQNNLATRTPARHTDEVRFTFTFASLVHNPAGIANTADLAKDIHGAAGTVDVNRVRGLAKFNGKDVGVNVIVTMLVPR